MCGKTLESIWSRLDALPCQAQRKLSLSFLRCISTGTILGWARSERFESKVVIPYIHLSLLLDFSSLISSSIQLLEKKRGWAGWGKTRNLKRFLNENPLCFTLSISAEWIDFLFCQRCQVLVIRLPSGKFIKPLNGTNPDDLGEVLYLIGWRGARALNSPSAIGSKLHSTDINHQRFMTRRFPLAWLSDSAFMIF